MAVKRKSNWYIYLIALVASFALLSVFLGSIWNRIFPEDDGKGRLPHQRDKEGGAD